MTRESQDLYEHCIPKDHSKYSRISLTLRHILPKPSAHQISSSIDTNESVTSSQSHLPGYQAPESDGYQEPLPLNTPKSTTTLATLQSDITTVYISSSMFRNLDPEKLSSQHQRAVVLYYPGATAAGILTRIQGDDQFKSINPCNVKKIFLLCGTNNVDRILEIPRQYQQDVIDNQYKINCYQLNNATNDISQLTKFLHDWATSAKIEMIIYILPRESYGRNKVINELNKYIYNLGENYSHINYISTEWDRDIFTTREGYRKNKYFSVKGSDNVHLNELGFVRLANHLKYLAHK